MFKIEDSINRNIYRHNGFRFLNLPITSSRIEIKNKFNIINKKINSLGFEFLEDFQKDSILPVVPALSKKEYNNIANRLNDLKIRLIDEIFWFWPSTFEESADEDAWEYLKNHQYDNFIQYWEDLNDRNVSKHNLAVFYHIIAFDLFDSGDYEDSIEYFDKSLEYWQDSLKNSDFKNYVKIRVKILDDPMLKESYVEDIFQILPKSILSLYSELIRELIKLNYLDEAAKILELISNSSFEKNVIDSVVDNLLTHIQMKISISKDEYLTSFKNTGFKEYKSTILKVNSYLFIAYPLLNLLKLIDQDDKLNGVDLKVKNFMDDIISVKYKLISLINVINNDESASNNIELVYLYYSIIYLIFNTLEPFSNDSDNSISQIKNQLRGRMSSQEDIQFVDFVVNSLEQELNSRFDLKLASQKIREAKEYANISNEVYDVGLEILGNYLKDLSKSYDEITEKLYIQNLNFMKYGLLMDSLK